MSLVCAAAVLSLSRPDSSFAARERDWRIGPVVYQVFVDRFAPTKNLAAKKAILTPPRVLKSWSDVPKPGTRLKALGLWSHELEFWGGDLESLRRRLGYIQGLGADVLYLNPIHKAFSNHKYDATDFGQIDSTYGTFAQFERLASDVHARGMKLMLDGVFNHMGKKSPVFQSAFSSPSSRYRDWFYFGKNTPLGYRGWSGVPNLPALRLENPAVRDYLWNGSNSIVRRYLREGADGWRLDVGFEIGPRFLTELTAAAHETKKGSDVVGEISGYPSDWFPSVDGVFNFYSMSLMARMLGGDIEGGRAGAALNHLVADAGLENLLRSWLLTDNHDTPRLANAVPDLATRKLLWGLQMTLPGSPVLYYGTELGMTGTGDPQNRAPMRWDLVTSANPSLNWIRKLIRVRKSDLALRYGDFKALDTHRLLAFARTTDRVFDTCIVVINPTGSEVHETFPSRVGRLMSWGTLRDVLSGESIRSVNGLIGLSLPAKTIRIYRAEAMESNGYSPYHRIP